MVQICPICLESIENPEEDRGGIRVSSCGHLYHTDCLVQLHRRTDVCAFCRNRNSLRRALPLFLAGGLENEIPIFERQYHRFVIRRHERDVLEANNVRLVVFAAAPLREIQQPQQVQQNNAERNVAADHSEPSTSSSIAPAAMVTQNIDGNQVTGNTVAVSDSSYSSRVSERDSSTNVNERSEQNSASQSASAAELVRLPQQSVPRMLPNELVRHDDDDNLSLLQQRRRRQEERRQTHHIDHMTYRRISCAFCNHTMISNDENVVCDQCLLQTND